MRSRTSRGVPEGSGGKDLYMGSCHADTGKFRGHVGIVPGPPEGFRGSTGRGHPSRGGTWAAWVVGQPLVGWAHPHVAHVAHQEGWPLPVDPRNPSGGPGTIPICPRNFPVSA